MEQTLPSANDGYRLYVGNMSPRMTESELRVIFRPFGPVKSVRVVRDDITGRSYGYAFVEITEGGRAAAIVAELNGKKMDGHLLVVRPLY